MSENARKLTVSAKLTEGECADLGRAADRDDRTVSDYIWLLVRRDLYGRVAMMDAAEQTPTKSARGAPLTAAQRSAVWVSGDGTCSYCARTLTPFTFTVDHVVPVSRGGTNEAANLVLSCKRCNCRKGDRAAA